MPVNNEISYSTIEEIHSALVRGAFTPRELYEYLRENANAISGSETAYHNLSVEFAKQNCTPCAADVAALGIRRYPMSIDLLPSMIKYAQESGNADYCTRGIDKLREIPREYWTWRTFTFVIDYYKDSLCSAKSIEEYRQNVKAAQEIIAEFKHYIPHDEHAYVAEAEIFLQQNDYDQAMQALENGVHAVEVAPQCCLKLADLYLEKGQYAQVEKYARKGILAASQEQPSVSVGYLYYLLALSLDAQRMAYRIEGHACDQVMIGTIVAAYQTADKLFVNEGRKYVSYRSSIQARLIIIAMEEDLPLECKTAE